MVSRHAHRVLPVKKKKLANAKWALWAFIVSVGFPQIANQTGWMTAEIGRQPWIVYGLLKTYQGVSPTIVSSQVVMSILMFIVIYFLLFALFIFLLDRKIKHGPEVGEEEMLFRNTQETPKEANAQRLLSFLPMVPRHWRQRHFLRRPRWI